MRGGGEGRGGEGRGGGERRRGGEGRGGKGREGEGRRHNISILHVSAILTYVSYIYIKSYTIKKLQYSTV